MARHLEALRTAREEVADDPARLVPAGLASQKAQEKVRPGVLAVAHVKGRLKSVRRTTKQLRKSSGCSAGEAPLKRRVPVSRKKFSRVVTKKGSAETNR